MIIIISNVQLYIHFNIYHACKYQKNDYNYLIANTSYQEFLTRPNKSLTISI